MCQCAHTNSKQQLDELVNTLKEVTDDLYAYYEEVKHDDDFLTAGIIETDYIIAKAKKVLEKYAD